MVLGRRADERPAIPTAATATVPAQRRLLSEFQCVKVLPPVLGRQVFHLPWRVMDESLVIEPHTSAGLEQRHIGGTWYAGSSGGQQAHP